MEKVLDLFSDNLAGFNRNINHREDSHNVVADALLRNPQSLNVESKIKVSCNVLPSFGLTSTDQFIQHFAFALRSSVHDSTGKTLAELFLSRTILTPLQRLVLVPENKGSLICQDVERAIKEAQANFRKSHKQQ